MAVTVTHSTIADGTFSAAGAAAWDAGHAIVGLADEISSAITAHEALADPHPGYLTSAEGNAAYSAIGHTHTSANITDFNEAAQDAVGGILTNGGGLTWAYNDAGNTISAVVSIASTSVSDFSEAVDDRVAVLLQNGGGITWTYNDAGNTLSAAVSIASASVTDFTEATQDVIGALLVDSATIDVTYNDGANTFVMGVITTGLDLFTDVLRGVVPASGGGTTNFLRADGTWAAPPSGSGGLTLSTVTVDVGSFPKTDGKFSISGTGLTVGKPVLVIHAAGPGGWFDDDKVDAYGQVTSTTNIDVYWTGMAIQGSHVFKYAVSS